MTVTPTQTMAAAIHVQSSKDGPVLTHREKQALVLKCVEMDM